MEKSMGIKQAQGGPVVGSVPVVGGALGEVLGEHKLGCVFFHGPKPHWIYDPQCKKEHLVPAGGSAGSPAGGKCAVCGGVLIDSYYHRCPKRTGEAGMPTADPMKFDAEKWDGPNSWMAAEAAVNEAITSVAVKMVRIPPLEIVKLLIAELERKKKVWSE